MTRNLASDRVQRILAIVPWIAAQDGPRIDEICARFGLTRDQLIRDIDTASFVGLAPHTPAELVEVTYDEERVWVHYPRMFTRPLRLTPEEGLSLLVAGAAALDLPGADPHGPLASALHKLADVLGVSLDNLEIDLGEAPDETFHALRTAIEGQHAVQLDYYSYGRDEPTRRVIEPWRMWSDGGNWYVSGHCRFAGGERVFRLDRITQAVVTNEAVGPPPDDVTVSRFLPDADTPRATVELDVDARWVLETYPADEVTELANGRIRAVLAVTAVPWLERLLLSLGSSASVVDIDPRLGGQDVAPRAAERVLARYRGAEPSNVRQP